MTRDFYEGLVALLDVNKRLLSGTGGVVVVVVVSTMAAGQVGKVPGAPPEEEEEKKKSPTRAPEEERTTNTKLRAAEAPARLNSVCLEIVLLLEEES